MHLKNIQLLKSLKINSNKVCFIICTFKLIFIFSLLINLSSCTKSANMSGGRGNKVQVKKDILNPLIINVVMDQEIMESYKDADFIVDSDFFAVIKTQKDEYILFIKQTGIKLHSSQGHFKVSKHFALLNKNGESIEVYNSQGQAVVKTRLSNLKYKMSDIFFGYALSENSAFSSKLYHYNQEDPIGECKDKSKCDMEISNNFAFISDAASQTFLFDKDGKILFDGSHYSSSSYYIKINDTFAAVSSRNRYAFYQFDKGEIIVECEDHQTAITINSSTSVTFQENTVVKEERKCLKDSMDRYPNAVFLGDTSQYQGFKCSREGVSCVEEKNDQFMAIHSIFNDSNRVRRNLTLVDRDGNLRLYAEDLVGTVPNFKIQGKFSYYINDSGAYLFHSDIPKVLFSCSGQNCASFSMNPSFLTVVPKEGSSISYLQGNGKELTDKE